MDPDQLKKRTTEFAHRCLKLAVSLPSTRLVRHIQGQLIRSSTSVAANYRAANLGQTKAVFIAKLSIVFEEVDESFFWIEFTKDENLLKENQIMPLLKESSELKAIFISSRKTAMANK